jgi:hypothetical protein
MSAERRCVEVASGEEVAPEVGLAVATGFREAPGTEFCF